jgi:hypothetical protein
VEALVEARRAPARRGLRRCALGGARQRLRALAWALGVLLGSLGAAALGLSCAGPLSDACDELGTCQAPSGADARAGDVGAEHACDPTKDPADEPCVLDNALGVFVAATAGIEGDADGGDAEAESPNGDGSMARPYATIAQALANLGGKTRVYVCNGSYGEQVRLTTAVSVYGGLACAGDGGDRVWSYAGDSAQVTSPSPGYALTVQGVDAGSVTLEDLSFTAPSATTPGASSIAALVTLSVVNLRRVTLSAGNGADGEAGADGTQNPNYTGFAPDGGAQVRSDGGLPISGGAGGVNACLQFGGSAGGDGGLGCSPGPSSPGLGTPGTANPEAPAAIAGRDGLPMGTVVSIDGGVAVTVSADDPGADGLAGDGGVAALAQVYGMLSSSGWTPSGGGDGDPGDPGQGGAGATDPLYGRCGTPTQSLGGGGGGAGGCGGSGGKGGGGGGVSIALVSIDSTVTVNECILTTGAAGTGGAGGAGQDGQAGGSGGDDSSGSDPHAPGAAGGNGAGGSGGAGGTGGISVGMLSTMSMITSDSATTTTLGAQGAGGVGGPAGRHPTGGVLTTGMDGNSGVSGNGGISMSLLELM